MNKIVSIISSIFVLIGIYLVVANPKGSVAIVNSLGTNGIKGIKTLQGR